MPIYERMTVKGRAGALQPYQSSQQAVAPGATPARVSDAAGAIYARGASMANEGLGRLAGAIGKAGHTFMAAYEDYSKTKATELFNRYREGMTQALDGENGILHQVGESAFHAGQQTMGTSSGMRADLLKDYGEDSRVAQIFNQLVDPQENQYHVQAQKHGEKEYKLWQDRTDDAAAKGYFDQALANYDDPQKNAQGIAGALFHVERQLRRKGFFGEALERGMLEASSKIYKAEIEKAVEREDYFMADKLLSEGERTGRMTASELHDARMKLQRSYEQDVKLKAAQMDVQNDIQGLKNLKANGGITINPTNLNGGIAQQAAQWSGKVKYFRDDTGRTVRDPRKGAIDCSGMVGWTLDQCGIKGFRGLNAEGQIDEAWARGAGQVSGQALLSNPKENMLIAIDTGPTIFDHGRPKGIDHIAMTYRDENGQLMVFESAGGGKGVRRVTWEQWLSERGKKTKAIYGADLSTMNPYGSGKAGGKRAYSDLALNEANNNPGNISGKGGVGKGYKAYNTTLEGFQALDQLIQTSYRDKTPMQLAEKYAPKNDPRGQNDPVGYAIQIARDLGMIPQEYKDKVSKALNGDQEARGEMMQFIDGDAKIDVANKEVRAKLMKSIAKREGPTNRFNLDEADYAAGVKKMPEGYKSKDLRKESKDQPGGRRPEPHDLSKAPGLLEKGNIDPYSRKVEHRPDGSIATVESFSFNEDGKEVLIPRVIDGKTVSHEEAIAHYHKTGEHLGKFDTVAHADDYAQKFHENQEAIYWGEAHKEESAPTGPSFGKLSSATQMVLDSHIAQAEGRQKGEELHKAVMDGTMTMAQAQEEMSAIKDTKKQARVREAFNQQVRMQKYAEEALVSESISKAVTDLQKVEEEFDKDPAKAAHDLWALNQEAQAKKLTGKKGDIKYASIIDDAYKSLGLGLAKTTDPAVYNDLSERIGTGEITTQEQLNKLEKYAKMAPKDKQALTKQMEKSQKVNYDMLKASFNEVYPDSTELTSTERKEREGAWKAFKQFAYDYFKETNRAENAEAYDRIAQVFFRKSFNPGAIDSETLPFGVWAARNDWDTLPEMSVQEKAYATKTFADSRLVADKFMKEAEQWKTDNGNSWATTERVAEMLFLRSQSYGQIYTRGLKGDHGPRMPDNFTDDIRNKAKWGFSKKFGCYGWTWADNSGAKFEPYVYMVKR